MEKLSRVKKYAELRKSIETDNNIDKTLHTAENGALEQEETLKKFAGGAKENRVEPG